MPAQAGKFGPVLSAVGGTEDRGIFNTRVNGLGVGERRLQMPHPFELPRMRRAIVPLVRARNAVVGELIAHRLPRFTAVVGALHQLSEPAGALRSINTIRIHWRT